MTHDAKSHATAKKSMLPRISRARPDLRWVAGLLVVLISACREEQTQVQIPMRDGALLAADLYLLADPTPAPTILIQTPYNKATYNSAALPLGGDERYNFVIVDWRGRYGSAGAGNPGDFSGADGYDTVEWIASQPWSNGHVGTYGASALAVAQFNTAAAHPPHLNAIVPMVSGFTRSYQKFYPGGVMRLQYLQDRTFYGYGGSADIVAHPIDGAWWDAAAQSTNLSANIGVPALFVGGWYDANRSDMFADFNRSAAASPAPARDQHRMLIGPWVHEGVNQTAAGDLEYPEAADSADEAALAFFDQYLRGTGAGPSAGRVKWFEMGSNVWHDDSSWPPAGASNQVYYFQQGAGLATSTPGTASASATYVYDPSSPSPETGGPETDLQLPNGPRDQTALEARTDDLVFSTGVLSSNVRVAGSVSVRLYISSNVTDTDFNVRLTDVYPDGRSMLVADAARKARFRESFTQAKLMTPGTVYPIDVKLDDVAINFLQGHRIRVAVASSNNPRFFPNTNDGGPLYSSSVTPVTAQNTIYFDQAHPSQVTFPVLPN